jgi:hypothetical protein
MKSTTTHNTTYQSLWKKTVVVEFRVGFVTESGQELILAVDRLVLVVGSTFAALFALAESIRVELFAVGEFVRIELFAVFELICVELCGEVLAVVELICVELLAPVELVSVVEQISVPVVAWRGPASIALISAILNAQESNNRSQ